MQGLQRLQEMMCTSPATTMPSEEAFGDAAFMFRLGNPQEVDWKMEGIEIQYEKKTKWWLLKQEHKDFGKQ